jgi:hypothetical protein
MDRHGWMDGLIYEHIVVLKRCFELEGSEERKEKVFLA